MNLQQRINKLSQLSSSFSFGKDIDNIHSLIFNETSKDKVEGLLRKRVSGNQLCVFGKLASKKIGGPDFHLSIVNSLQLYNDDGHLFDFLRNKRVRFKERARGREVSAHPIYSIHPQPALARPSEELVDIQKYICSLHMPECYLIKEDVIYTEGIPFQDKDGLKIHKAGANVFYSSVHRTRNHDRRIPGGILISVNAPGYSMRLAIEKGFYKDQEQALADIRNMIIRSADKGGYSHPEGISITRHLEPNLDRFGCPAHTGNSSYYSGFHHTDVLIPGELTKDERLLHEIENSDPMISNWNVLFYISLGEFPIDDPYYGEFIGTPVDDASTFFNSLQPRKLENKPLYEKEDD